MYFDFLSTEKMSPSYSEPRVEKIRRSIDLSGCDMMLLLLGPLRSPTNWQNLRRVEDLEVED